LPVARKRSRELSLRNCRIAVIGLGYVGLPLAVEFGKHYDTVGFDIDPDRIAELRRGVDRTLEVEPKELRTAKRLKFTAELRDLRTCRVYVITVPTPIDADKRPDLGPLERASESVGKVLKRGDIVIYESTVFPGCTEEICVPILEKHSGLRFNEDFHAGYSPERINPGDREHRLPMIRKVTAGSTPEAAAFVDKLYASIIRAGTHPASSIRVAEAAKVIENTQRDVNIALVNELAMIFNRLGIDTQEVLEAAGSKWNFLPFRPGLVGGHCIGVDPYYLTHKAQQIGYHPEMILAGRRINDNMALYVAGEVVRLMASKRIHVKGSRILVMGLAFKENTPDLRNSKVADLVAELAAYGARVDVWDPWVSAKEAEREYGIQLVRRPSGGRYDAIVLAVGHREFVAMRPGEIRRFARRKHVVYDVKYLFSRTESDGRL
jgi:UDP-N-acetyl-D-glucosamine/UDP-N-acetyl-D-galactosamine dehydrogenase